MIPGRMVVAAILAVLVSGCASEIIQEEMTAMIGYPAEEVFLELGLPDAESRVAGRKFYVWNTQASGSYSIPQQHTGTIQGAYGPSTYTYTTFQQQQYHHFCNLRVFVDSQERVTTFDFEGNEAGCGTFADLLDN